LYLFNQGGKLNHLNQRKDHRTLEQFKNQIKHCTKREGVFARVWFEKIIKPLFSEGVLEDTGVDNTGEVVTDQKADFSKTDFGINLTNCSQEVLDILKLEANPSFLNLEVKISPRSYRATIKEQNFQMYERIYDNSSFRILVFISAGEELQPSEYTEWFIVTMKEFEKFRTLGVITNERVFGYKPAWKIDRITIDDHFSPRCLYSKQ